MSVMKPALEHTEVRSLCGCRPGLREQCIERSPVEQPPAQDDCSNATHIRDVRKWIRIEQPRGQVA